MEGVERAMTKVISLNVFGLIKSASKCNETPVFSVINTFEMLL